ncbi:MAG: cobalamin-dependent protein, partial [Candidatus Hodarchaeota archaeon]
APHFGDFVIGTPAAVENTIHALKAGATTIGNLGQYFNFRMPKWTNDVFTTTETVKAIALCANQSVEILIHSNLDDGFAALFHDMTCSIGAVLLERYIVEDLIGGFVSHCYGHTFSDPLTRFAFQRALAHVTKTLGSMVYGNTTIYGAREIENYANLASYLLVDIIAQQTLPTGHGINPVPVTEAMHIPEINEIVDVHLFAHQLVERAEGFEEMLNVEAVRKISNKLIQGGQLFKKQVLIGLKEAGININNPVELLLALRRVGAKRLEELFGPGELHDVQLGKRIPVVQATTITTLEKRSEEIASSFSESDHKKLRNSGLKVSVACTDVHEYGKIILEEVLKRLGIEVIDVGVSVDPNIVAKIAGASESDFIAISTYSGIALTYLESLYQEMSKLNLRIPVLIGGKLTQIPNNSTSSKPIDVTDLLASLGAIVCHSIEDVIENLLKRAQEKYN